MKNYSTALNAKHADPKNSVPLLLCCLFMLASCFSAFSQVQLGADIDGELSLDLFGFSVSLSADGNRLAIGAPYNDGSGNAAGHVRVFNWTGSAWEQLGADIDGEAAGDQSGYSVSLSADGNQLAIGGPYNDGNGIDAGHVRVYHWTGSAWIQQGGDLDGEAADDQSGWSVSLSADGNRLAIGAPYNGGNGLEPGHVRVYHWTGSAWTQLGADIDGEAAGAQSGWSVSLSADGIRLAVGAPSNPGAGLYVGHVRVYDWTGSAWTQLGADIDGEADGDVSGFSVSLSADGGRVAVGAPYNDGTGPGLRSGHVRVYDWTGSSWIQLGTDINGEKSKDQSGWSVSLSADGSRLAVGAHFNSGAGLHVGHVRVYDWTGSSWTQFGTDIDGESSDEQSGKSVSISAVGARLAIGAPRNTGPLNFAGHARVYSLLLANAIINIGQTNIEITPNPTWGVIQLNNVEAERVQLLDNIGRIVFSQEQPGSSIDISSLPTGLYFMKINAGNAVYSARVIKQ